MLAVAYNFCPLKLYHASNVTQARTQLVMGATQPQAVHGGSHPPFLSPIGGNGHMAPQIYSLQIQQGPDAFTPSLRLATGRAATPVRAIRHYDLEGALLFLEALLAFGNDALHEVLHVVLPEGRVLPGLLQV